MSNNTPIYLDYAAATPLDERALIAMKPYFTENFYNPSAVYQFAREVRHTLEAARAQVASVIGSKDQEVIFTAGGTEANNIALHGIMRQYPDGNIIVSSIEHESVLEPASQYDVRVAPVFANGIIDLQALESLIDEQTVLISVMYANNEIGTVQPIKEIASIIQKKRTERTHSPLSTPHYPLLLHTDACQAANYLDLQVTRLGVDMMTLNGGKIYGPKQSGCLYVRTGTNVESFIHGGGQESGIRSGTENVANCIGFATMLQKVQHERKNETIRIKQIRDIFFAIISQQYTEIKLNGDKKKRLPNNLNITVPGADGERLLMELDYRGVMVATGSACTASNDEPSHVLRALGLSAEEASASLRIVFGRLTTEEDAEIAAMRFIETLKIHQRLV